ncbi:MAG: Ribonuclease III (EC [uncultured Campylobacterales bacterium]|uniref:Ribonuclease 3 n=1 Tax=uncultured Campylobacterales bacterium TaxID=352960 RepID=A0A6S6SQF3_9BACT|nr:MAG: Ribonuclease III (EC [uncultured Campylobacterales bacterium]
MPEDNLRQIQKILNYKFKNIDLLIQALTHKSYKKPYNYERLEFLGDAVLDLIIGEYLYLKFQDIDEGYLSKLRAALVSKDGFTKLAYELDLHKFILLSDAEIANKGRHKPSLLSSVYESVMGALYLDAGLEKVKELTLEVLDQTYSSIDLASLSSDYKTKLQEITQAEFGVIPDYKVTKEDGPDHKKSFEITLYIHDKNIAVGYGNSKKQAQQSAAKKALQRVTKGIL